MSICRSLDLTCTVTQSQGCLYVSRGLGKGGKGARAVVAAAPVGAERVVERLAVTRLGGALLACRLAVALAAEVVGIRENPQEPDQAVQLAHPILHRYISIFSQCFPCTSCLDLASPNPWCLEAYQFRSSAGSRVAADFWHVVSEVLRLQGMCSNPGRRNYVLIVYGGCCLTCSGVPDSAHLYLESSAKTARAVEQRLSLIEWAAIANDG